MLGNVGLEGMDVECSAHLPPEGRARQVVPDQLHDVARVPQADETGVLVGEEVAEHDLLPRGLQEVK